MGVCVSKGSGGRPAPGGYNEMHAAASREKDPKATDQKPVKILLLGPSNAGKTTIFKQLRLVHRLPFTPCETESYRQLIFLNITDGLQSALARMNSSGFSVSSESRALLHALQSPNRSLDLKDDERFPSEYRHPVEWLWRDPNVQAVYESGNEVGLPENLAYFSQHLDRLFDRRFQPTHQDILHAHVCSTGVTMAQLSVPLHTRHSQLTVVDVGGSRSERRKWPHCAEGASAVLFVVNLAGYNQSLREDEDTNQMEDALEQWAQTCRAPWLAHMPTFILLLNKNDLFEEKVAHCAIKDYFPDYKGPSGDADAGRKFFMQKFRTIAREAFGAQQRSFYYHFTTATNTMNIRLVMASVQE